MDAMAVASANCRCSRVVYVGNIAFHASDDEIRDACELIGPVLSLNIATDSAPTVAPASAPTPAPAPAAKPKRKGYAFVEYADDETARSACRNLNGHLLRGRELRVGLADRRRRRAEHEPVGMDAAVHAASLLSGAPIASLTRYLAARSTRELRELVATIESQGADSAKLLKEHVPGLATAMEQIQHLLDMDAAAEEASNKKRARASDAMDHRAKVIGPDGNAKAAAPARAPIVPCF